MLDIFLLMIFAHALADYPIQASWIASTKNHRQPHPSGYPWYHSLTAHSVIHAGFVGIITGSSLLALFEFVAHWLIDYGKSEELYGVNLDQTLHILCKVVWLVILALFMEV